MFLPQFEKKTKPDKQPTFLFNFHKQASAWYHAIKLLLSNATRVQNLHRRKSCRVLFDRVTIYGQTFTRCSHSFLLPTLKKPVRPVLYNGRYTLSKFSVKDDLSKR